jgi:hypothetical protein
LPAEGFVLSAGNAFLAAARNGSPAGFHLSAAGALLTCAPSPCSRWGRIASPCPRRKRLNMFRWRGPTWGAFMSKHAAKFSGSGLKITTCSGNTVNATMASGKKLIFRVSGNKGHTGCRM